MRTTTSMRSRGGVLRTAIVRIPYLTILLAAAVPILAVTRLVRPAAVPAMLRRTFELSGGGLVKVGQLLATRYDLLPPAYCDELGRLLDRLPAVSSQQIR